MMNHLAATPSWTKGWSLNIGQPCYEISTGALHLEDSSVVTKGCPELLTSIGEAL